VYVLGNLSSGVLSFCQGEDGGLSDASETREYWRNDELEFALAVIAVALAFDFANGWHDSANSIAMVVATRVFSPRAAVVWAAFFNFIAFLVFRAFVAQTIGGDLIRISVIEKEWRILTLLSALIGATVWDVITWRYGLPSSSSHALIGGYAGSAIAAHHGVDGLLIAGGWFKTVVLYRRLSDAGPRARRRANAGCELALPHPDSGPCPPNLSKAATRFGSV
jgi:hypothetical protein